MPQGLDRKVIRHPPLVRSVEGILDWLDIVAAERIPSTEATLSEIMFAAGRRDLAKQIRREVEKAAL